MNEQTITEVRKSKMYSVDGKTFTPEVTFRNGEFNKFVLHTESGFKIKYTLQLDKEDEEVFNVLRNFFKSL